MRIQTVALAAAGFIASTSAHGNHAHEQAPIVDPNADWATKHMAAMGHGYLDGYPRVPLLQDGPANADFLQEEHHIAAFDAGSFFNLHDYDSTNEWTVEDIMKTYGLRDESTKNISEEEKQKAVQKVIEIFDRDRSGTVSFAEYTVGEAQGLRLPDLGYGPGHHGDDEYEYEIHHFEKYHDENTREEDLIHPEDIEHFRKHEEMEAAQERQERMDKMPIVESNIPAKFRRELR